MPSVTYDSSSFIITTSRAVARRIVVVAAAFDSALTDPSTWATSCAALRASGFNTIVVRVPWSLHEPTPDRFDFTGSRDIRRLCLEAATAGLHVILRIGPVVGGSCASGGLPSWIAERAGWRVRESDPAFMQRVSQYWQQLSRQFVDLQATRTGPTNARPIIAVGLEDDWRCLDVDVGREYFRSLVRFAREFGVEVPLISANNCWYLHEGVIDAWSQDASLHPSLIELQEVQPESPRVAIITHDPLRRTNAPLDSYALARTISAAIAARAEIIVDHAVAHAHCAATSAPGLAEISGVVIDRDGLGVASARGLRRTLVFASSFGAVLAPLHSTATLEHAIDPERATTPIVCTLADDTKSRVSVAFALRASAKKKNATTQAVAHEAADGSTHEITFGSASGVEFHASDITIGHARLERCTGSLVALMGDVLVIAGEARTKLSLQVSGTKAVVTVAALGAIPKSTKIRSLHVIALPFGLADGVEIRDGALAFVDEHGVHICAVSADGAVKRLKPTAVNARATTPITFTNAKQLSFAGLRTGTDARFASAATAESLGAYGLDGADGFYRATWTEGKSGKARAKASLALTDACGVTTHVATQKTSHTLIAEVIDGQLPSRGPHCGARVGVFGALVEVTPLKGVTCAVVDIPAFDPSSLGRFVHGYDARGGIQTLQWSFAARTSAVLIELPALTDGVVRLNGEIVAVLGGSVAPHTMLLDGAKLSPKRPAKLSKGEKPPKAKNATMVAGKNELLLDVHAALDAKTLERVRNELQIFEVHDSLNAQWSFARVSQPATWVLATAVKATKSPTWFRSTFDLNEPRALTLTATHLNAPRIFVNGTQILSHERSSDQHTTRTVRIPATLLRSGTNELTIFDRDGRLPTIELR